MTRYKSCANGSLIGGGEGSRMAGSGKEMKYSISKDSLPKVFVVNKARVSPQFLCSDDLQIPANICLYVCIKHTYMFYMYKT